jgi:hypothetical protein
LQKLGNPDRRDCGIGILAIPREINSFVHSLQFGDLEFYAVFGAEQIDISTERPE